MGAIEDGLYDASIEELWTIADELTVRLSDLVAEIDVETDQ